MATILWAASSWGLVEAQVVQYKFADLGLNLEIPDGGIGTFVQHTVANPLLKNIQQVTISLDISGTWSGDLYAYLNMGGAHAVLLNRVGKTVVNPVGYGDHGFQVRFDDYAASGDIHQYRVTYSGALPLSSSGALLGNWAPDGRATDPDAVVDTDPRTATLSSFRGMNGNGQWTLFLADLAPGSVHELTGWELSIRSGSMPAPPDLAIRRVADGIEVRFRGEAGVTYRLETATGLPAKSWQALATRTAEGSELLFGPYTAQEGAGFFRVRTVIPGSEAGPPELKVEHIAGGVQIRFHGETGALYRLESTTNLATRTWQPLAIRTGDGRDIVLGPFTTQQLLGFFRVQIISAEVVPGGPELRLQRVAGGVEIRFTGEAGVTYWLGRTAFLPVTQWQRIATRVSAGGETVFGPFSAHDAAGFFRVQAE